MTGILTQRRIRVLNQVCWTVALCVAAIPFVFPFLWMVSSGFKSATEIFGSPSLVPREWQWRNFIEVFNHQPFARQYFNSLYIAVTVTALTLVVSGLAALRLVVRRGAS